MLSVKRFILLVLFSLVALSAHAAVVIYENGDDGTQAHVYQEGTYYHLQDGQLEARYSYSKDDCLMVNHQLKIYFQGSCKKIGEDSGKVVRELYEERLGGLSKEERAMMNQIAQGMSGRAKDFTITAKASGKVEQAGYSAEKYVLTAGSTAIGEMWFSTDLHNLIQKNFDLKGFGEWMRRSSEEVQKIHGQFMPLEMEEQVNKALVDIVKNAYLVKSIQYDESNQALVGIFNSVVNTEVTRVEQKKSVDAGLLAVPAGYQKVASWAEYMKAEMFEED